MTISASTRMDSTQKTQLDNMNVASQRVGGLGARLDAMQYDGVPVVSAGAVAGVKLLSYTLTPALATATATHAAITLTTGVQVITTAITNPDFPRQLTVKGNDANVTGNVVIIGTDFLGAALTETIALNGSAEVVGTKVFKTVTSIQVPVYAVAGTETVSVGRGAKVGFPIAIPQTTRVIAKNFNGSTDAGTVTAATTVYGSVYAAAGTFDGAKVLELVFFA